MIDFAPDHLPDYAGVGFGLAPDYIGSDAMRFAAAPVARASRGERYVDVVVNFASANLLDDPNRRIGPAAALRLSRDDVVDRLPDIDMAVELGGFIACAVTTGGDRRQRLRIVASVTHDVLDEDGGYVASASVRKWFPVSGFAAFGLGRVDEADQVEADGEGDAAREVGLRLLAAQGDALEALELPTACSIRARPR